MSYPQLQKKLMKRAGTKKEEEEDEVNGPECFWHDGEREPEGDPEEWTDNTQCVWLETETIPP